MTPDELYTLIAAGESLTLEFKSSFDKAAIQSLVAFANAQGGRVLVGLSDTGQVIGTTLGKGNPQRMVRADQISNQSGLDTRPHGIHPRWKNYC